MGMDGPPLHGSLTWGARRVAAGGAPPWKHSSPLRSLRAAARAPRAIRQWFLLLPLLAAATGCQMNSHTDRGAALGGLSGAGVGALIGESSGNPLAGAAIGAGVGALTGATIGQGFDEVEARNRAMIEAHLGRRVAAGAVTIDDVLAMSRAGVEEELIVTHVQANGMVAPLTSNDLIALREQQVSTRVIQAMQTSRPKEQPVVIHQPAPRPVIVEEYYYGPPRWYYPPHYRYGYRHRRPRSGVSWGISFSN